MSANEYFVQRALNSLDSSKFSIDAKYLNLRCDRFTDVTAKCTAAEANEWDTMGAAMGFSEFIPSTVNWNIPVPWRGDASATRCSPDDTSGCPMPLGGAFAIVFGFGVAFTILTVGATAMERRISKGTRANSEHFNTAGRNIKTGLTASVIVSQWTWAATLLQSSNKAWQLGVSGPFWYASGATIQVLLFGILAIEVKRKCPNAHTFLEIVDARWGTAAHITFLIFGFFTNILVTGMLLLGGGAVLESYAGMNKILASFLMPLTVIFYTVFGGLKATFMASYFHTCIIMSALASFVTVVYLPLGDFLGYPCTFENAATAPVARQCDFIGSAGIMYERLAFMIQLNAGNTNVNSAITDQVHHGPVNTNREGSYLTMMSGSGFMFGVINTVGNFGTVFVDQSYWQSAIAASPASAHKGYLAGGLVWFTIPFALATSLGLTGIALNGAITADDAGAGLVPPAAATMLIGPEGGTLMMITLFMAIVSTGSAECIAVSSLVTYDIYRKYCKPRATNDDIMFMSRVVTCLFGLLMGTVAAIFAAFKIRKDLPNETGDVAEVNLSMGWVYVFMGNAIGSAVAPVALAITWKDANKWGAICGAWGGLAAALISWITIAGVSNPGEVSLVLKKNSDGVAVLTNVTADEGVTYFTLLQDEPLLVGNLCAILVSLLIHVVFSMIAPQNYDWELMKKHITLVEGCSKADVPDWELSEEFLGPALAWSWKWGGFASLFLLIIWPVFFSFPWGVMPKGVFALWVSVAFAWGWLGAIYIITMPIIEYWPAIKAGLTCGTLDSAQGATKTSA